MTRNYSPITEPGTTRTRVASVSMLNPHNSPLSIIWQEEDLILLADGTYRVGPVVMPGTSILAPALHTPITETSLMEEFPIVDIDRGQEFGTMSGQMLLAAIQSYYLHNAKKRDAAEIVTTPVYVDENPQGPVVI